MKSLLEKELKKNKKKNTHFTNLRVYRTALGWQGIVEFLSPQQPKLFLTFITQIFLIPFITHQNYVF